MDLDEARAWLAGERSTWNTYCSLSGNRAEELAMSAVADAALTWQALAIVRAAEATQPERYDVVIAERDRLRRLVDHLSAELARAHDARIAAQNPGIDLDKVRAHRAAVADTKDID